MSVQKNYLAHAGNALTDEELERAVAQLISLSIPKLAANRARNIVRTYGERYEEALDAGADGISAAPGIDYKTRIAICKEWEQQRLRHRDQKELCNIGASQDLARRLYETYNDVNDDTKTCYEKLKENPYTGIAKKTVSFDEIELLERALHTDRKDERRISWGIYDNLYNAEKKGDTQSDHTAVISQTSRKLRLEREYVAEQIWKLNNYDVWTSYNDSEGWTQLQLSKTRQSEELINSFVRKRTNENHYDKNKNAIESLLKTIESNEFSFGIEQQKAMQDALRNAFTVIIGRAGSGKTTIMKAVVSACKEANLKVGGCAPTGLAATRLQQVTGARSHTIHRLLGISRDGSQNTKLKNIDQYDVLIVDETSMIGTFLFEKLVSSISDKTTLILLGDPEQLPSIEPGAVLRDLSKSPHVRTINLAKIYRQGSNNDGSIVNAARSILDGKKPLFTESIKFIEQYDEDKTAEWINGITKKIVMQGCQESNIRVISPIRSGKLGVTELSYSLREKLNPSSENDLNPEGFRENDQVIYTENNNSLQLSNGDLGRIMTTDGTTGTIKVAFSRTRLITLGAQETKPIRHAMALSGHQTQGNEFAEVIIPIAESHRTMLDRTWLYTAIARAKKRVILVGSPRALEKAIKRPSRERRTGLSELLESNI